MMQKLPLTTDFVALYECFWRTMKSNNEHTSKQKGAVINVPNREQKAKAKTKININRNKNRNRYVLALVTVSCLH